MATQQLVDELSGEARLDDPEFYLRADRFSTYARLRREAPVYWSESAGSWVLSKHADIAWAELQGNPPLTTREGLFIREAKRPDLVAARDPGGAQQAGAGFHSDPPQHTQFRRLLTGAFAPGRLSGLEPMIQTLADELLDQLPDNEPVDFMHAVSAPLAIRVIAEFLGVPREAWTDIWRWTDAQQDTLGGGLPEGSPEALRAAEEMAQMRAYFAEQLAERARAPREDFMSTVATLEIDGRPLPDMSQLQAAGAIARVGNDTTRNLLAGAMATFVEHPAQWEKLVADPTLVPSATEELLRWVGPVIHFGRRATQPLVIRDQPIAAGDFLIMLFDSGNRDEEVWPHADTFDVTRGVRSPHLGFGMGIHRCVGASLARLEIRIVLEGLIKRFRSWELAGPPVRIPSTLVHTYKELPIVLKRR
jgi:cytochrome P450